MISLNVSFGIHVFLPQGWLFMVSVIVIECLIMVRLLVHKWAKTRIFEITTLANIISGLAGFVISMILNGGWYLVLWLPWVSNNEIDLTKPGAFQFLLIYYAAAFLLTLLIEISINILFLRKHYPPRKITKATILANITTYVVGTIALYSYSFQ